MNYLCKDKSPYELKEEEVHEELRKGWNMFSALIGSVYKDALWDDLRTLAAVCSCVDNEVKLAMNDLVLKQPHNFY